MVPSASWMTTQCPVNPRNLQVYHHHSCAPAVFKFCPEAKFLILSSHQSLVRHRSKVASFETHQQIWEEADDGSRSEYEEEEEEDEGERGSDCEVSNDSGGGNSSASSQYEEDLLREVEELLGPDEKAILHQNVAPNLEKISTTKWRPLHTLGLSMQIPSMDKMIEIGVDIDEPDKDGLTALHMAIIGKKEAVISHLLRKGANPHVKDRNGATPLHYAAQVGALQTVKLLMKYQVDLNIADNEGWTPLHVAVQSRNRSILKLLLISGADKSRKNMDGKTGLDLSLCYGKDFKSYDLARLLKILPTDTDF